MDSLDEMQQYVVDELEYLLKGINGYTLHPAELVEEIEDEMRSVIFKISIKDQETTHQTMIFIEIDREKQDYSVVFGEDNTVPCTDVSLWQAMFFNKEDSEDSKVMVKNLNNIISGLKNGDSEAKLVSKISRIDRGWK